MKSGFKFLGCLIGIGLISFLPVWSIEIKEYTNEAGVDNELPPFSDPRYFAETQPFDTPQEPGSLNNPDNPISLEEALWEYQSSQYQGPSLPPSESTQVACTTGLMTYYSQGDKRWADSLYGPSDRLGAYGCGPTAVAMIVNAFTQYQVTPLDTAQWAGDNGYCSPGEGSRHSLIPDGLRHYGLSVDSMTDYSAEAVLNEVRNGKIVIALMDKGYFTKGGHFILMIRVTEDNKICIADPASWDNTNRPWDPEFILSQIRPRAEAGGPLWVAGLPPER